jgi:DNA-binding NarL/FixJ family response regulator
VEELFAGIRTVAVGDSLLSPAATRSVIAHFLTTHGPGAHLAPPERLAHLTAREREVMALAAEGKSNDEIASMCTISLLTVRTHIQRVMAKLEVRDRAQLVVTAYQSGLVQPPPGPPCDQTELTRVFRTAPDEEQSAMSVRYLGGGLVQDHAVAG